MFTAMVIVLYIRLVVRHSENIQPGWAKSLWANVGLNSSVNECPIEVILSGMTYYHHWLMV